MAFELTNLLRTAIAGVWDAVCDGTSDHAAGEDIGAVPHLVFPYRGAYVRHVGREEIIAEPNQVLFSNSGESLPVSHPVRGGDASLLLVIEDSVLRKLPRPDILREGEGIHFKRQNMRIDPRTQALVAMLRYSLRQEIAEPLEAESLALTLAQRAVGPRTSHVSDAGFAHQRLVDRTKLVLTSNLARRWTLAEIAAEVGGSPVYLTQVFRQVEGVPLYRYQLRLRLAKALDLMGEREDLSALSHELGFSSHSHFTAAFRQTYGRSPTEFRQSVLKR